MRMRNTGLLAVAVLAGLTACDGDAEAGPPSDCAEDGTLPGCVKGPVCRPGSKGAECLDRAYFRKAVVPILERRCAACHIPGGMAWGSTGLDLTGESSWDSLVNTPSHEMAFIGKPMLRVHPGLPDSSYLYLKVALRHPPYGSRMPLGEEPLSAGEIETFKHWIEGRPYD